MQLFHAPDVKINFLVLILFISCMFCVFVSGSMADLFCAKCIIYFAIFFDTPNSDKNKKES
jgi:hypothetical protein